MILTELISYETLRLIWWALLGVLRVSEWGGNIPAHAGKTPPWLHMCSLVGMLPKELAK